MFKKIFKRKKVWIPLTVLVIGGILLFTLCHSITPENRAQWVTDKIASKLELNEDQKGMLDDMRLEFLAKHREMHDDHAAMKDELIAQLKSEKIDREQLDDIITKKRAEIDSIVSLFTERFVEFHDTMTPEQKSKLVAGLEKMKSRHGRRSCFF